MNDNVITNDDNDDNDNDTIVSAGSNNNNNNHTKNNEQDDKTIIAKNSNENDDSKSSTKTASDAVITTPSASNTTTATNISTNIQSSSTNIKTEANLESWNNTSSSSSSQPQPPQSQSQYSFGQAAKGFNERSLDPALFAADPSMKLAPTATTTATAPTAAPVTSAATSNNAPATTTTSAPTPIATSSAPIGYYNQAPIFDSRNGASFILTTTTQPTPQDYPSTTYSGRFTNGIAVIPPPNFSISPNNNNKQSPSPSPRQVTSPQSMMTTFSSKTVSSTPKRYKCSVCQKRFTRPSSLQTHMYSHTGEKPFKCPVEGCGRHFSVVSNLRRHQKIHTNNNNNSSNSSNVAPSST